MAMSSNAILDMLYKGTTTLKEFQWDTMTTVPLLYLMTPTDIDSIRKLILSPRYSGNNRLKMQRIDELMHIRGFSRFAGGTNRLVYIHPSAPNAVFKVAIDSVGINDNPAEFRNQRFLKPYCCKVFECSPCGTIASFEKVDRITSFEEFYSIADDYYYLITRKIIGKYIMEDIGTDFFMNIGIRKGFGCVLLDFPYLFELDGKKLECRNHLDDGSICGGEIDYDECFNKLICTKCGRHYRARDLAKPPETSSILLRDKGGKRMNIKTYRGDQLVKATCTDEQKDYLPKKKSRELNATGIREAVAVIKDDKSDFRSPVTNHIGTIKGKDLEEVIREDESPVVDNRPVRVNKVSLANGNTKRTEKVESKSELVVKGVRETVEDHKDSNSFVLNKGEHINVLARKDEATGEMTEPHVVTRVNKVDLAGEGNAVKRVIKAEDSESDLVVRTSRGEVKSEEHKVEEVKKAEPEKTVEPEPTVVSTPVSETVSSESEEVIDNPEVAPITEEDAKANETELIPAITFGDDDSDNEEDIMSAIKELEGSADDSPIEGEVKDEAPEVADSEELTTTDEDQPVEIPVQEPVILDNDGEPVDEKAVDEFIEAQIEPEAETSETEETTETEDEDESSDEAEWDLRFVTKKPSKGKMVTNTVYYVPKDKSTDLEVYRGITNPALISEVLFDAYIKTEDDDVLQIKYNADEDSWDTVNRVDPAIEAEDEVPAAPVKEMSEADIIASVTKSNKKSSIADIKE